MPDAEKCDNLSMAFVLKCHLLRQQHLELALKRSDWWPSRATEPRPSGKVQAFECVLTFLFRPFRDWFRDLHHSPLRRLLL